MIKPCFKLRKKNVAVFYLVRRMFEKKFVENMKTHVICSITLSSDNLAFYETKWKEAVDPDRSQMTILV